ncbi:MAG: DsrE family protein [Methylococcaceae bacterium]
MTKNFLFVLRKPSYDGIYVQEMFDIILTTAAFEQEVSILLLDDAVFHLKSNQTARKNVATLFEILPTMDVDAIFVETESLAERGLKLDMLTQSVELKSRVTISDFMTTFDVVFAG